MLRFCLSAVFLVLHACLLNSIVIQVKPHLRAKDLYLSVSNASLNKNQVDTEKLLILRPSKTNSLRIRNESFSGNQRIYKIDNSTNRVTGTFPRTVIRRAPPPYAYIVHQTSDVKPIYELEKEPDTGLAENQHTGYSYDPPLIANDWPGLSKYETGSAKSACTPEEIVAAIEKLDRLLNPVVNSDGYNSPVHPPTNPVLALILSRYGRYLGDRQHSNVYSYMAVNNIHNTKPFGQYKHE